MNKDLKIKAEKLHQNWQGGRGKKTPFPKCTIRTLEALKPLIKKLEANYIKKNLHS